MHLNLYIEMFFYLESIFLIFWWLELFSCLLQVSQLRECLWEKSLRTDNFCKSHPSPTDPLESAFLREVSTAPQPTAITGPGGVVACAHVWLLVSCSLQEGIHSFCHGPCVHLQHSWSSQPTAHCHWPSAHFLCLQQELVDTPSLHELPYLIFPTTL